MDKISDFFRHVKHMFRNWGIFQWVSFGICMICLVIVGIFTANLFSSRSAYESAYADNAAQIALLKSELSSYENAPTVDPDVVAKTSKSAYAKGSKVASLQNSFWQCYTTSTLSGQTISEALTENIVALSEYFDETTAAGTDIWFQPDMTITNLTDRLGWFFVSDIKSSADEFDVLWLCRDSNGYLVAYATGVFHTDTELFSDIHYGSTSYGRREFTSYVDDPYTDPENDGTYMAVDNVDIPAGYQAVIRPDGSVDIVDSEGNSYSAEEGGEDYSEWQGGFHSDFSQEWDAAVTGRANAFANKGA